MSEGKVQRGQSQAPVKGQEATGTNWNTGGSLWTSGNTSTLWRWSSTGTGCSRGYGVSILRDIQKPSGQSPGQRAPWGSAWAEWLDQKTSRGPCQLQPSCDSV